MGITYDELDKVLPLLEKKVPDEKIHEETRVGMEKISKVKERMVKTEFKRKPVEKP